MWLFGRPNLEKMKAERDIRGLIGLLRREGEGLLGQQARAALVEIGEPTIALLMIEAQNRPAESGHAILEMLGQIACLGKIKAIEALERLTLRFADSDLRPVRDVALAGIRILTDISAEEMAPILIRTSAEEAITRIARAVAAKGGMPRSRAPSRGRVWH